MLNILTSHIIVSVVNSTIYLSQFILWDPGAYSGGKGKTEQAEKNGAKKSKERLFFAPFFFRPFSLSLAPTICLWVSEDAPGFKFTRE